VSALATNKIVGFTGTLLAVIKYALAKKINWQLVGFTAIPCLGASYWGSQVALTLSDQVLAWMILLCIPMALFFVTRKSRVSEVKEIIVKPWLSIAAITPIGFYDGLLGPGTGSYMAIAIHKLLKFNFLDATASVKPLNLLTNLGAAMGFIFAGKVLWSVALPMAACSALGGWLGGRSAIAKGDAFIRQMLLILLVVMLLANLFKMLAI